MEDFFQDEFHIIEQIKLSEFENQFKAIEKKTSKFFLIYSCNQKNSKEFNDDITDYLASTRINNLIKMIIIQKTLNHPVILKIKEYRDIETSNIQTGCILITKYPQNCCISTLINEYIITKGQNNEKMNPLIKCKIIYGVADAIRYLHENGIYNNNIKSDNIYLDCNFEPKIINNYLTSKKVSRENRFLLRRSNQDPMYFSPKKYQTTYISNNEYLTDAYSFGLLLFSLFTGQSILPKTKPDSMPESYWELASQCTSSYSSNRPKFDEITRILNNDKFLINEFGMKTDKEQLREYRKRVFKGDISQFYDFDLTINI